MATYILLDPNEMVQQQQAMAAVAAHNNSTNNLINNTMTNKCSLSNDVSSNEHYFLFLLYLLTD
jgi:hypothetical protein